jgi:hypothetical protein
VQASRPGRQGKIKRPREYPLHWKWPKTSPLSIIEWQQRA